MIDAHQHYWFWSPRAQPWIGESMAVLRRDYLPRDLEPLLAQGGFQGSVAVQAAQTHEETRFLLRLADAHPSILGVVGWVDLAARDLEARLERLAAHPRFVGVRHIAQDEPDYRYLARPDVVAGIAHLARHDLAYDVLVYPRQLPAALALARALPGQRFVLDHLGKPEVRARHVEPWATDVRALARCPNVVAKLSGLVSEAEHLDWRPADFAPYFDVALSAFGPERLMLGSDWPVCRLAAEHAEAVAVVLDGISALSPDERAAITAGTAQRTYRLGRGRMGV
jgi:L-fuconolactonase